MAVPALTLENQAAPSDRLRRRPFEVQLPREGGCSAIARRLVERHFSYDLDDTAMADLKHATTELVDHAYFCGEGAIRLRLQQRGEHARVEVVAGVSGHAVEIPAGAPAD